MLPRVKISFDNSALRMSTPMPDGVGGAVLTGVTVVGKFVLGTTYIIRNLDGLKDLGITSDPADPNAYIFKFVNEFYQEAAIDTELWIMGVADTVKLSDMASIANDHGKALANAAGGKLRWLAFGRKPAAGYIPTPGGGLDGDVALATTNAQALAEYFTNSKFAPLFCIIDGAGFTGAIADLVSIRDITTNNRVCVLIGDTVVSSYNSTIGTLCGRIASIPVQRNIARVKDGAVTQGALYIGAKTVDAADFESIHDKGYITFRTIVGRGGYFFNDDFLAAPDLDDYSHITARRTVDKAYRIAYQTLVNELNDEVPINADGTLPEAFVKNWQAMVEFDISRQMTANGELSGDIGNGDLGVQVYIDPSQNVSSTSKIIVKIRVRPFGYARFIDVYLGFQAVVL